MTSKKYKLVLGVTGSIAAYKAAYLTSAFVKEGLDVYVVLTKNAERFVGQQTFMTLSQNRVITSLWENNLEWKPEHIKLADTADLLLIAPATANFIAKFANAIADDALSTFAISFDGRVIIAPAMNPRMWKNQAVQENVKKLLNRNVIFIGPGTGKVACGDTGIGRLANTDTIQKEVLNKIKI